MRRLGDKAVFVAANLTGKSVEFKATVGETPVVPSNGRKPGILMAEHGTLAADGTCSLGPWGYVVVDL